MRAEELPLRFCSIFSHLLLLSPKSRAEELPLRVLKNSQMRAEELPLNNAQKRRYFPTCKVFHDLMLFLPVFTYSFYPI